MIGHYCSEMEGRGGKKMGEGRGIRGQVHLVIEWIGEEEEEEEERGCFLPEFG